MHIQMITIQNSIGDMLAGQIIIMVGEKLKRNGEE